MSTSPVAISVNGVVYRSYSQAAKAFNVSIPTIRRRVEDGVYQIGGIYQRPVEASSKADYKTIRYCDYVAQLRAR